MSIVRFLRATASAALIAFLLAGLMACTKEGPVERAGKEVDKAASKVGQQIEKAGDSVQDAAGRK